MPCREDYSLRPITEKDLKNLLTWRNSELIRANMYTDHVITMEEHREWFDGLQSEPNPTFLIFEFQKIPLGVVNITQLDRRNSKCHWGFYVGEPAAPRGSGTILGYLGLEYIFETLGVRKLVSETFAFNQASMACHRKLGFIEEGRFSKHTLKKGNYEDVISYALFKDDWLRLKRGLEITCFGQKDA